MQYKKECKNMSRARKLFVVYDSWTGSTALLFLRKTAEPHSKLRVLEVKEVGRNEG